MIRRRGSCNRVGRDKFCRPVSKAKDCMNKAIHASIVLFFGVCCWFLWGILTLTLHTTQRFLAGSQIPEFTRLCIGLRPLLVVLPMVALGWCLYSWFRKTQARESWIGFFASTMAVLVLVMLPTLIAAWLPLISIIAKIGRQ